MKKDELFAFVLMPFDSKFDDIYQIGIKEVTSNLNIKAERVDEQIYQEGILDRIYRQIDIADIIIADMTGQNPNVFYEVGYAHAKNKTCILLTSDSDDIPFDLKHKRHIIYNSSVKNLRSELKKELQWAKQEIETVKKSHIEVSLKSVIGSLNNTKYASHGTLTTKLDLNNQHGPVSPEIEAAYIYSGKGWVLFQDGKECPSTQSDIQPFMLRHLLTAPCRKLHKDQWVQLVYESKKQLASALNGEELKDSYRVSGRSILRLVTSTGNYDFEFFIDTYVDDIPF